LLITDACFFLKLKPTKEDLTWIFHELDTDHDGFITFQQYADFIRKYLGNNTDFTIKKPTIKVDIPNVSEEEYAFVFAMWDELKRYFDKYDQGAKGFLTNAELKAFAIEVLN
jgi:Ca2+-binding EF-hand superfamily protein